MSGFRVPRRDQQFLVHQLFDFATQYQQFRNREVPSIELIDAILDESAKFSEQVLYPLNASGDQQGCRLEDGRVIAPDGFAEAYQKYIEGGWASLPGEPEYGGQGLPYSLNLLCTEMRTTANHAWDMYPGLSHGAISALQAHGSDEQKALYLSKLLSGHWTGTMCLTEPHAGSDVGMLRTRAEPEADGSYRISGTKIFISAGEHDLAENIVHLVLARLPDAPPGTKGVSLFIVPRHLPDSDGNPGPRNAVHCGRLENKMGIHGNATCELHFEGATGYMVGAPNKGMRAMFTMMNTARIAVGVQGMGNAEAAYQQALAYARERLQMRSLTGPKNPDGPADPILVHPDVRRMLLWQKAFIEGSRALAYYAALQGDIAEFGASEDVRATAQARVDFLTPIVKGFLTEAGLVSVNHAVQVFGGHGFIRETGVEQYVRDCRITLIYEGTTQIQGLDLLGRKTLLDQGRTLKGFAEDLHKLAVDCRETHSDYADQLNALSRDWTALTDFLGERALQNPDEAGAAAVDFLMFSGYALLAYFWVQMSIRAGELLQQTPDDKFLQGKQATAAFYMSRMLPQAEAHRQAILAGGDTLLASADAAFEDD